MGSGWAATAIQVQCALDGAKEISIFSIKDSLYCKAENTVAVLTKEVPNCMVSLYDLDYKNKLYEEIKNSDILINGTAEAFKLYTGQDMPVAELKELYFK